MKKLHEVSNLIDIYGKVISLKQFNCITLFYFHDLSLQEIADIQKTTRAAVYNNIKKATEELFTLEKKLAIIKKNNQRQKLYAEINDIKIVNKFLEIEGK